MTPLRKINRVWYSDIRIAGKRVRRPLSTDKEVALEKLRELNQERDEAKYGTGVNAITWARFKVKYLAYADGSKAKETAKRDRAALSSLEKFERVERLVDITPEFLERWKGIRRKDGRGPATINRDLSAVKALMRKAKEWGYLKEWDGSTVKYLQETPNRLLFYSPEELGRLLTVCKSRYSAFYDWETICLLGARAGLRRSEIHWLAWEDVDLKRGTISVTPKQGWQPKTGEQRHIPIAADLQRRLLRLKRPTEWVIGERPSTAVMSAFFAKICRKAKLRGSLHTLRHTFASHLVQNGVDLYTVSKLLGHSDPNMSKKYAHLAPKTYEDAVAKLPEIP